MKSIKIFKSFAFILLVVMLFGCSSSDDSPETPEQEVTSIVLSASRNTLLEGESISFSVTDNLNNNVTSSSTLSINGNNISNPYTFSTEGVYNVVASLNSLTSSSVGITVSSEAVETSITVSLNSNPAIVGEMVTFTVMNNLNTDVTSSSTFSIQGTTISNPYQFNELGEFTVDVSYGAFNESSVINIVRDYTKKALLEDFTGTWCPNCPPAAAAVANAISGNANIFGVGYHVGVSSYPDPMEIPETDFWGGYYHVTGYPTVYVNGPDTRWNFPDMSQVNLELFEHATLGLAVDSQLNGNLLDINVKVGFSEIPSEEVKLMIYLVEDNVTSSSAQSGSSQGVNYVHRDVLREVYTDQLGDVIPSGSISLSSDYELTFTDLTLPNNIENIQNLKVIVYVRNTYTKTFTDYFGGVWTDSPHYDIYNVQEVHVGSSQVFD